MYIEQVQPPVPAKHLLALDKMSQGQRVSKPLKTLQSRHKPWDAALWQSFDKMQVFSAVKKEEIKLINK